MEYFLLLAVLAFASKNDVESALENSGQNIMENAESSILVKIEENENVKKKHKSSGYIGVYEESKSWRAARWSPIKKKTVSNGSYKNEKTAAYASDNLARKLMAIGEQNHKLNFPDENAEVHPDEKSNTFKYFGVYCIEKLKRWRAQRWSTTEKRYVLNGVYKDDETAAHASDTLARKLMADGEHNLKLNFPDDSTEVFGKEKTYTSEYVGVFYDEERARWRVVRRSKTKNLHNGHYRDEKTAAHASDTLARILITKGEKNHKLNFPDDQTEVYPKNKNNSKYFGVFYNEKVKRWYVTRWSKSAKKHLNNRCYRDEETAALASDTLARKLMSNGEVGHKLNFPDNITEVNMEKKRNYLEYIGVYYHEKSKRWVPQRWSKTENRSISNGGYYNAETAAHASDTLARKLIANGEQNHKLNFPDDDTEVCAKRHQKNKRKRPFDFEYSQTDKNNFEKFEEKEK